MDQVRNDPVWHSFEVARKLHRDTNEEIVSTEIQTEASIKGLSNKLTSLIVDETKQKMNNTEFLEQFADAKLNDVKKARLDLKDSLGKLPVAMKNTHKLEQELLANAKFQCFKWALLKFTLHPSIRGSDADAGGLRKSLKDVWEIDKTHLDFMQYLEEWHGDLKADVANILDMTPKGGKKSKATAQIGGPVKKSKIMS